MRQTNSVIPSIITSSSITNHNHQPLIHPYFQGQLSNIRSGLIIWEIEVVAGTVDPGDAEWLMERRLIGDVIR